MRHFGISPCLERFRRSATALGTALAVAVAPVSAQPPASLSDTGFARLIESLSEPPGFFDTDNLISNEDSYLHPLPALARLGVSGGAYLGVGPDQNYSYIAAIRPRVAFIIDIRRDNMLEHLLFKAMFDLARNRLEYLCLLFGRAPPADTVGWGSRGIADLLRYIDGGRTDRAAAERIRARVLDRVERTAVRLSQADLATIARFHGEFIAAGPSLKFNSFGRAPQSYYPDLRRLLMERDRAGRQASFLARESDFQFVKSLHARNLIVPVTGDFGGAKVIPAVAQWLNEHGETVSAFYTSNVEQYLFRDGSFTRFASHVARLPRNNRTVIIRSYFQGGHPHAADGYHAVQLVQLVDRFAAVHASGGFASYSELVRRDLIPPN